MCGTPTVPCASLESRGRTARRGGGGGEGVEEELRVVFPFLVVLALGLRRDMDRAVNGIRCANEEERGEVTSLGTKEEWDGGRKGWGEREVGKETIFEALVLFCL